MKEGNEGKNEKEVKKKVSFGEDWKKELEDMKKSLKEDLKKVKIQSLELDKLKNELKQRELELLIKAEQIEKKVTELENRIVELEEKEKGRATFLPTGRGRQQSDEDSTEGDTRAEESDWGSTCDGGAATSRGSGKSRRSMRSVNSAWSLSDAEVWKMKKMMRESERKDREKNIVIKGLRGGNEGLNECVNELMNDRLGIKVKVEAVWKGGSVIVVKLGSIEDKKKVMVNKSKLAGTKIFIENDLSYEDRKKQEEIGKWVKERKEEGKNLKIGFGKIFDGIRWIKWEDKQALKLLEGKRLEGTGCEEYNRIEEASNKQTRIEVGTERDEKNKKQGLD